jgi:nucleotide-binding universal stress UspA family protein
MLKSVMIPLDGSALANTAIEMAVRTISPECEIVLLNAVPLPEMPVYGDLPLINTMSSDSETLEALRNDAKNYLEGLAHDLRQQGFRVYIRVEIGQAAMTILRVADECNVDMIIMSTHGRTGFGKWLFGSVTNQVLAGAKRPVLVIPSKLQLEQRHFERATTELYQG